VWCKRGECCRRQGKTRGQAISRLEAGALHQRSETATHRTRFLPRLGRTDY
jgi:hypothetical protein